MPFTFETSVSSQNVAVGGAVTFKFKLLDGPPSISGSQLSSYHFNFKLITTNMNSQTVDPAPNTSVRGLIYRPPHYSNRDIVRFSVRVYGSIPGQQSSFYVEAKSGPGTWVGSNIPYIVNSPIVNVISAVPETSPPLTGCEKNIANKDFTGKFLLYPLDNLSRYPATIYLGPRTDR